MKTLDKHYGDQLEAIKNDIQQSPELATFLEEEDEYYYQKLQETFEKRIVELYDEVAANDPLQLFDLEERLLDPGCEGLFFPRLMGYAVLRGDVDDRFKYVRPQEHFKKILLAMCNSPHFDYINRRVGQSIQIGFALSSDIWITHLLETIENKQVANFLNNQKINRFREQPSREAGYKSFQKQFQTANFQSTDFPSTQGELTSGYGLLRKFLEHRVAIDANHNSYIEELLTFAENQALSGQRFYQILFRVANFISFPAAGQKRLAAVFNRHRKTDSAFSESYFSILHELMHTDLPYTAECDQRIAALLDAKVKDDLSAYYGATRTVAQLGFVHPEALDAVRELSNKYDGLSTINHCLRQFILKQLVHVINHLSTTEYTDYFELNKSMIAYMDIFDYQQFNQILKETSMQYVGRLLARYTDKRGRDYQDIKKYVSSTFLDIGFLKEKEVVELFKTRRREKAD